MKCFLCLLQTNRGLFRTNLSPSLSLAHAHYMPSKWRLVMSIERFSVQVCPLTIVTEWKKKAKPDHKWDHSNFSGILSTVQLPKSMTRKHLMQFGLECNHDSVSVAYVACILSYITLLWTDIDWSLASRNLALYYHWHWYSGLGCTVVGVCWHMADLKACHTV